MLSLIQNTRKGKTIETPEGILKLPKSGIQNSFMYISQRNLIASAVYLGGTTFLATGIASKF